MLTWPLMQEERAAAAAAAAEDEGEPAKLLPTSYDSLRLVPAYAAFINERFERCLDLYLCPRTRRHAACCALQRRLLEKCSCLQD